MADTGKIKSGQDFKIEDRACINRPLPALTGDNADCVDINDGPTAVFASGARVNVDVDI